MTRRVFRHRVIVDGPPAEFEMGSGPILHVDATTLGAPHPRAQHVVDFWWEHHPDETPIKRSFVVVGTGHPVPDGARHRGTTDRTANDLVWHLYELEA